MPKATQPEAFKVTMRQTRVTKNTIRYDAADEDMAALVANVYVRKDSAFMPPPQAIEVEVRPAS